MGVDLEKKRKLLLYPIEYNEGPDASGFWDFTHKHNIGFARTAVMRAGSNMGPGGQG